MRSTPIVHRRARRAAALVAAGVAMSTILFAGVAVADDVPPPPVAPPPPPPVAPPPPPVVPDPSPEIRVLAAQLDVMARGQAVARATLVAATARTEQDAAEATVSAAQQTATDAENHLDQRRDELGSLASVAFMQAGGGDLLAAAQGDPSMSSTREELFDASLAHHDSAVTDAEGALDASRDALDQARQVAADATARREAADAAVTEAQTAEADARAELARANRRPSPKTAPWRLPIESTSTFTAQELAAWYQDQGQGSQASVPVEELTRLFIDEGAAEGVRGDMAFAQAVHETGWFANSDTIGRNNFAGIGHCSACDGGFSFASAEIGVRAQIQLLKSYAEADPHYLQPRADPSINGPAGCCPDWADLGGVWASDVGYGPRILTRYRDMLAWLVRYRATEPLFASG